MTLADRQKTVYRKKMLGGNYGYAETGTFTPRAAGSSSRALTASVTVRESENETDNTRDKLETIELFILRDEADDLGGVAILRHGDKFARDSDFDSNSEPFVYRGDVIEKGLHYYRATFERFANTAQGRGA